MMGDLSGPVCQREDRAPRYLLIRAAGMTSRDALMVNGFDIIGQNRTLQVHWGKRIAAFFVDCIVVLTPVWILLFLLGERRVAAYRVAARLRFFSYAAPAGGRLRGDVGEAVVGLQVRPAVGPLTPP